MGLTVFPDGRTLGLHHYRGDADYGIDATSGVVTRTDFTSEDGVRIQRLAP